MRHVRKVTLWSCQSVSGWHRAAGLSGLRKNNRKAHQNREGTGGIQTPHTQLSFSQTWRMSPDWKHPHAKANSSDKTWFPQLGWPVKSTDSNSRRNRLACIAAEQLNSSHSQQTNKQTNRGGFTRFTLLVLTAFVHSWVILACVLIGQF